ncbi:MAG: EamA family transporter [Anaerolineae bacterium]|nr:EamA family transporter [Anaerolineae bacterium]
MDWFWAACVSAVLLSGQGLAFQQLQRHYPIQVYMTYIWWGSALILAAVFLRPAEMPAINANLLPLVLAGFASWTGVYCLNRAIKVQTNIGYIEAIIALRIVITYVFSLVALQAPFDLIKLAGVLGITIGVFAVAGAFNLNLSQFRLEWLKWALAASLLFAAMTIFVRTATDGGVGAEVATVVVLVVAGALFFVSSLVRRWSFRLQKQHLGLMGAAILVSAVGNAANFIAFKLAPNLAYAIAIDNTRMIILYIIGLVLFSEKIQRAKAVGIILTFAGVILMS